VADAPDFAAEGLLDGLDGEARESRQRLLAELHADGESLDALRRAVDEERLALLPVERVLGGAARYTPREIAERSGVAVEDLQAARRAFGLPVAEPDERVLSDHDLEAAHHLRSAVDAGLPMEELQDVNRVMGRSMAQVAAAMRQLVGSAFLEPGVTEHEVAQRYVDAVDRLGPALAPTLTYLFSLHLRELLRTDVMGAATLESGALATAQERAVGFADLVGFTRLGGTVPADELGRVARRLEKLADEHVPRPVRVVKSIGDAVLLVARDPEALVDATLRLVQAADAEGEDFPQLRAGLAFGETLERDGDVYGHTVNLASRITAAARPGSVLADERLHDAVGEDAGVRWSFAGARKLRGVPGEAKLFRARPAQEGAGA
jgi:adenylate cyclase